MKNTLLKDGLQNVPFDRMLMRVKDICSICASLLNIILSICTIIGGLYFVARKIDDISNQIHIVQQQQSATQQMVVSRPEIRGPRDR